MTKMTRLKITLTSIKLNTRYIDVAQTNIFSLQIVTEFGTKYYKTIKYENE